MTLYGISGKAGHGKDTFSKAVVEAALAREEVYTITHFADPLKYQAIEVFGITEYDAFDEQGKESPFDRPITMDEYVGRMREVTGLAIQPANLFAKSPRELLQYYGTEYVRKVQNDYWVRATLDRPWNNLLISDTRFPNEAKAIREVGGKIIKVVRMDMPISKDGHSSETSIDLIEPDIELRTWTGDFTRINRMAKAIASGSWGTVEALATIFRSIDLLRENINVNALDVSDDHLLVEAIDLLQLLD